MQIYHLSEKHAFSSTQPLQPANGHVSFGAFTLAQKCNSYGLQTHAHAILHKLFLSSLWSCDDGDGEHCVLTVTVTQSCLQHKNLRGKRLCFKSYTLSALLHHCVTKYCDGRRSCSFHTMDINTGWR